MNLLLELVTDPDDNDFESNEDDGSSQDGDNESSQEPSSSSDDSSHETNTNIDNISIPPEHTGSSHKIILVVIAGIIATAAIVALVLGLKWQTDRNAEKELAEEAEKELVEKFGREAGNNYIGARNGANSDQAKLNRNTKAGGNKLYLKAILIGNAEEVKELIAEGYDVNDRNDIGCTPLHFSLLAHNAEITKELIAAGADLNAKCNDGRTPLHMALNPEATKAVIDAGADVNAKDNIGNTPYHSLTLRSLNPENKDELMKLLKNMEMLSAAGADINAKNNEGLTPLDIAEKANVNRIIDSLMANVKHEISLEEGRSPNEFFSIKKGLKPCLKSPQKCSTTIAPLVEESHVKFNRGIIATILLLNNGQFDKQVFDKVHEAMIWPLTDSSERMRIANLSPAGREIMSADKLSDEDKTGVLSIWYLRQIPYAGEDIWKTKGYPKRTWNEYLDMANMYLDDI